MIRPSAFALASLLLASVPSAQIGAASARYEVTFTASWSSSSHPSAYPFNAHFSPLIGATHQPGVHLWEPSGIATPGIEQMAETGATSLLTGEINTLITAGTAGAVIQGAGINSPGSTKRTFAVSKEYSAVSLVTMIAPSPDWFIGVDDVQLFENNDWVAERTIALYAWDAGTDAGLNFNSGNQNVNPHQPIELMTDGPFFGVTPLGTFTFRRLAAAVEYGTCNNPEGSLVLTGAASLGNAITYTLSDASGSMPTPSLSFLATSSFSDPSFPCGTTRNNWGLAAAGTPGDLLLGNPVRFIGGPLYSGAPVEFQFTIPNESALIGREVFAQGILLNVGNRVGVTSGIKAVVGP